MGRGALIVFEGADRSGKTTQTLRFTNSLRSAGIAVADGCPWRFPDRNTDIGIMINAYLTNVTDLDDNALHLLFSANRWEKAKLISDSLARGETVVLDRYAYSGVAYSVAKGLDLDWCKAPDRGLPAPDVVAYLDLSVEAAAKRGEYGKERYENEKIQRAVAGVFTRMRAENWRIVDADGDQDTVFARVTDAIMPLVAQARASDKVGKLWS